MIKMCENYIAHSHFISCQKQKENVVVHRRPLLLHQSVKPVDLKTHGANIIILYGITMVYLRPIHYHII